jgi:hypothetical protein
LRQRQGLDSHCHFGLFARRKQAQNDVPDVPQLPDRSSESWKLTDLPG